MKRAILTACLFLCLAGCSEATGDDPGSSSSAGAGGGGSASTGAGGAQGEPFSITVPDQGRVFLKLDPPSVAMPPGDGKTSSDWDLAFEGFDVHTNSGASGAADGGAFGPLGAGELRDDVAPDVPFIQKDAPGGAFLQWYAYDGTTHALYSRYHVYGIRDGQKLWKVQILGYYGEVQGGPVSALYQLRYAEVTAGGIGATTVLMNVDGTAGGVSAPDSAPSGCVDFGTGKTVMITPADALKSSAWHICFRRDKITVNGGIGGPRGVTAADLQASATATEMLDAIEAKTAASELPRFDAATNKELSDPKVVYHGDRIVSAFSDRWTDPAKGPAAPVEATWLAVAADGEAKHLLAFEGFTAPTSKSPGTVAMRIKLVQ